MRLHRDVERADRLVGDDQLRIDGQRARDADPLPLPAGELVRVAAGVTRAQPDRLQQLGDGAAADRRLATILWNGSASSRVWPTVMRGLSEEFGS